MTESNASQKALGATRPALSVRRRTLRALRALLRGSRELRSLVITKDALRLSNDFAQQDARAWVGQDAIADQLGVGLPGSAREVLVSRANENAVGWGRVVAVSVRSSMARARRHVVEHVELIQPARPNVVWWRCGGGFRMARVAPALSIG